MSAVLFVDRDGTLIDEPPDEQVDALEKVRFTPGVFAALTDLQRMGYRFVMVTNQDGLGTPRFPKESFEKPQQFVLEAFASQGIQFEAVCVCPHFKSDTCECRKPKIGLLKDYLRTANVDLAKSAMVGDRDTDIEFARNLGVRGLRLYRNGVPDGKPGATWPEIVRALGIRQAHIQRKTKETDIQVTVNLDATDPIQVSTGIGFFDHMLEQLAKHGGFALQLSCKGDLHIDEHHTIEDTALALGEALRRALGTKSGIARYGFLLPMDEARAQVGLEFGKTAEESAQAAIDLSGRAYAVFEGQFGRDQVGTLPTELVPHFFRSLAESLGAAIHVSVKGDNTHHMIEACFKGVGRALRQAFRREGSDLPTTKGVL